MNNNYSRLGYGVQSETWWCPIIAVFKSYTVNVYSKTAFTPNYNKIPTSSTPLIVGVEQVRRFLRGLEAEIIFSLP